MLHMYNGILFSYNKDDILPFVTMWINSEGIMLSEMNEYFVPYDVMKTLATKMLSKIVTK